MQESKPLQSESTKDSPSVHADGRFPLIMKWRKFRKTLRSWADYLIYNYRLAQWRILCRWRNFKIRLSNYTSHIRRLIILLVALSIAAVLVHVIDVSSLSLNQLSTYFISLGAMTGGIIAIVFTLSIFAQQIAADLYSSQHFEVYTHDLVDKCAYIIIVIIALLFFGFGILVDSSPQIDTQLFRNISVYGSILLIAGIFVIIDIQYENVRLKINPINAFTFLEKQAIKFLDDAHKDARRIARIVNAKQKKLSKSMALASAYINYLTPLSAGLDRCIENLFEISMKLSDRNEINTTNRGLAAVRNILLHFLQVRKDSSVAIYPISLLAVESDSHEFLSLSFERFNTAGEYFIRKHRIENASFIINIYGWLAVQSKEINFINEAHENPYFDQIRRYLSRYIDFAIREKNQEIVLQGTIALSVLATAAIEKNFQFSLTVIQNDLLKSSNFGISNRATFIVDECNNIWLGVIGKIFHYKSNVADIAIKDALKHIKTSTVYMYTAIKSGYLSSGFIEEMRLAEPYDELRKLLREIKNDFYNLTDEKNKSFYRSNIVTLLDELYNCLRRLSEEIHDCDSPLIDSIGRLIYTMNTIIIDLLNEDEFKEDRINRKMQSRLDWNIHLPYWFAHHAKRIRVILAFNTLTDSVAKTGIILFQKKFNDDHIMECVDSLFSMMKQCLEKAKGNFSYSDSTRQMKKVVYLGVLSLKHNKKPVLEKIKEQIEEFETLYQRKYLTDSKLPSGVDQEKVMGIPKENQLYMEILSWRHDFLYQKHNRHRSLNSAIEMMYDVIDEADIDRFIFEVWKTFPENSSIANELSSKAKKKRSGVRQTGNKKNGPKK